MATKNLRMQVLIVILIVVSIFIAYHYSSVQKRYVDLKQNIDIIESQLDTLQGEKEGLKEALESQRRNSDKLIVQKDRAIKRTEQLNAKLLEAEKIIDSLNINLANLRDDNVVLRGVNETIMQEKAALTQRLKSLGELKKAIRQVKLELYNKKIENWLARIEKQKEIDARKLAEGNQGYVIRDGKSTLSGKTKIEVKPAY